MQVIAYGIDYVRFSAPSDKDVYDIASAIEYIDIYPVWHHGHRYMDITGSMLEVVRIFDDVNKIILDLATRHECSRVDVFIDVMGRHLDDVPKIGTVISNNGAIETIYSTHLKRRGDTTRFGRAYDAKAAGHYECDVTRFEVEFKREVARSLLRQDGWKQNPIGVALHFFQAAMGVNIWIEDIDPIEMDAPRKRYEHSRERFYTRYGKSILNDMHDMGLQRLRDFVIQCQRGKNEKKI